MSIKNFGPVTIYYFGFFNHLKLSSLFDACKATVHYYQTTIFIVYVCNITIDECQRSNRDIKIM